MKKKARHLCQKNRLKNKVFQNRWVTHEKCANAFLVSYTSVGISNSFTIKVSEWGFNFFRGIFYKVAEHYQQIFRNCIEAPCSTGCAPVTAIIAGSERDFI